MGNIEQEQAEAMKRYIREVFIPEYAKNFNKELSTSNIKFYGKIHFDRGRSDNELNMHCHLIVSRKDQANKKKLSPFTNHKNTQNGVIKGGFNRVNLFQRAEQGFDKLFNYNRQQVESFHYQNTIKNGSMSEQLKLQEQEIQSIEKRTAVNQDNNQENKEISSLSYNVDSEIYKESHKQITTHQLNNQNNGILASFITPSANFLSNSNIYEELIPKPKKIKKKRRKL